MKKFLIINPFGIGDVLFTTPVARAVKLGEKDAFLGYWCNQRVRSILENSPYIDKIFDLSRGDIKKLFRQSWVIGTIKLFNLINNIKKESFDISLDFSLDHRYSLISKLAGIKTRIGYNFKGRSRFLTKKIDIDGYVDKHAVEYYLDILKFINIKDCGDNLDLFLNDGDKEWALKFLAGRRINKTDLLIGIAPGAGGSWGKDASLKHWPLERFAQLAEEIVSNPNVRLVILGDAQDKDIAGIIADKLEGKAINLAGLTTLGQLCAVINNLNLLVANDGGPLHIAVALGVKTVSIFGPVDDKVYGPYPLSDANKVIKSDIACRPCYNNFRLAECANNRRCVGDVSVSCVYQAVRSLM